MRTGAWSASAALAAVVLFTGCQQQQRQEPSNPQQARLLAAQNADMQRQLTAQQTEIETLRQKCTKELRQRDLELIRRKARIDALEQELKTGVEKRVQAVTAVVLDENARLRQEIEQLKAQVDKPKAAPAKEGG